MSNRSGQEPKLQIGPTTLVWKKPFAIYLELTWARFDDCLRLGKRIDEGPYLLPNPEIHRLRLGERIPDASRPDLQGAVSPHPGRLPTPAGSPSPGRRDLSVFQHKKVMLSGDLEVAGHLRGTIEELIRSGGGEMTVNVGEADIYVCHYREGDEYKLASRAGKDVGNLPWLYHLITNNTWTSPLKRLLHYPIARRGLPGFKKYRISLSNYNGEARIYLENLAKAAGCEFTKTMKMDNTHLVTAHTFSEKCEAAREWNINMINHLWLEESYAKWEIQSLTHTRYTTFPPRTNLSEVVGQTEIDKKAVARHFFPENSDAPVDADVVNIQPPLLTEGKGKSGTAPKIDNSSSIPAPDSSIDKPGISDGSTPKVSKQDHRRTEGVALKTPASSRFQAEGKENETPSTSNSRGAKDRAVAKLHDLAPDIALYEKEKKRVGGVVFGGGRKASEEMDADSNKKRPVSRDADSNTEEFESLRDTKRAKNGRDPPTMRLLLSGYNDWVGNIRRENEARVNICYNVLRATADWHQGRLRELGILVTQEPTKCTHLAAPRILRTPKFLCAIAHAPTLLSTAFVDDCLAENALLPTENYRLKDPDGEKCHEMSLTETVVRAKANKGRLLRQYSLYCTEHVHGGFDAYRSIVEVNGGRCLLYRARAGSLASSRIGEISAGAEESEPHESDYVYLISGTTPKDARLWPKFREMVQAIGRTPRIVKNDWILDVALTQELRWKDDYEITDADVKADG